MNIYVYSDESGVFDNVHNNLYAFGGLIFLSKESRDECVKKYSSIEKDIRKNSIVYSESTELKANILKNKEKRRLFNILHDYYKFGVVIHQQDLLKRIFLSKKDKQRYLDYAFKLGVKKAFEELINAGVINPAEVENIIFFIDEHTTATNGLYELKEALIGEFKNGTYNKSWNKFYEPIFPYVKNIDVNYRNSNNVALIRSADIIANRIWNIANSNCAELRTIDNLSIKFLP